MFENSEELSTYIKQKWDLKEAGFNYNLAAVFGSQSTGKSKYTPPQFAMDRGETDRAELSYQTLLFSPRGE